VIDRAVIPKRSEGSASNALRSESRLLAGIQTHAINVILSAADQLPLARPSRASLQHTPARLPSPEQNAELNFEFPPEWKTRNPNKKLAGS
jgi:hypothetical protein